MSVYRTSYKSEEEEDINMPKNDKLAQAEMNAVVDTVFDVQEKIASLKNIHLSMTWKGIIKNYDDALNLNLGWVKN